MADRLRVRHPMSAGVLSLRAKDPVATVEDLVRMERIRHLPVLGGDGALCGIVSQRDLFRGALADAARRMSAAELGCLVLVDEGRRVGILTESDFVRRFASV